MSILTKMIPVINLFLLKVSNGRVGSRLGAQSVLLLQTVGRKSGKIYKTPLSYYRDDDHYLLVASNWGQENLPHWYLNLRGRSETTIQIKGVTIPVLVRQAGSDEYARLWELIARKNPMYTGYQKKVKHKLPIMILRPVIPPFSQETNDGRRRSL